MNTKAKLKVKFHSPRNFEIVAGVLRVVTLTPYLYSIWTDCLLQTSIDLTEENCFTRNTKQADYADDIALLANTPNQTESLLHSLE